MLRRLGLKRFTLLLLVPGYLSLIFDAGVGHYAGEHSSNPPAQMIPIVVGTLCMVLLLVAGAFRLRPRAFGWLTRVAGVLSALTGVIGVVLHGHALWEDAAKDGLSRAAIEGALSSGPPLLAPSAFAGVGMLVLALGWRRVKVELIEPGAPELGLPAGEEPSARQSGTGRAA